LQQSGQYLAWGGTAALYAWGLYDDDVPAREHALTGVLSTGLSALVTLGLKHGFGRLRPRDTDNAFRFFENGDSFVSGAATPIFSLAATLSEYGENRWYFSAPAYAAAAAVGIGRMGQNAHWFSDVVGSAIVGVGTTELLLHLHREHAENPGRFRIFPVVSDKTFGVSLALAW
jgi:membrane-associated phospholipid phosphatase